MEIITAPEIYSSTEAMQFVQQLLSILRAIGTCDGQLAGSTWHAISLVLFTIIITLIDIFMSLPEGSLRVDANISLRPVGATTLGTRAEVKNINGIKHLAKAIGKHALHITYCYHTAEYEIRRQSAILHAGGLVEQETRTFDVSTGYAIITITPGTRRSINQYRSETVRLRSKSGEADYRFLPEPDLPALHIDDATVIHTRVSGVC